MNIRLVIPLGVLLLVATQADAQTPPPAEIVESQQRLERIRRERADLRQEMTRIQSRVSDLSTELENVEMQVEASSDLLSELDFQLEQREALLEENRLALEAARGRLASRQENLHDRLRQIYKRGPLQTLEVLLAAESFSDLLNRYKYLFIVARQDRLLADEVLTLEQQLLRRERALRSDTLQLQMVRRDRANELVQLSALQEQQTRALQSVRTRGRTAEERLEQLAADEEGINDLITGLERTRQSVEAGGGAPAGGPPASPPRAAAIPIGAMPWPVNGSLLYDFGSGLSGNRSTRRSGIGIGAPAGTSITAVAPGQVVLAGPFEGYGRSVVLSHGRGYYSLYLYLGELRVSAGDQVAAGQLLALVGNSGSATAPFFEFQVRAPGGEVVNPLTWLAPR